MCQNEFFYKNNVDVTGFLQLPKRQQIIYEADEKNKVKLQAPGKNHPSDHFSLIYKVRIT